MAPERRSTSCDMRCVCRLHLYGHFVRPADCLTGSMRRNSPTDSSSPSDSFRQRAGEQEARRPLEDPRGLAAAGEINRRRV